MKKIFTICLFLLTGCTNTIPVFNNDINTPTITFIKKELSTSLLIYNNNETTLIELENKDKIFTSDKIKINNLVLQNSIMTDIDYDNKYILTNNLKINDILIEKTDKLLININNNNLCIYDVNINESGNYELCDYIYILNNEDKVFIKLNENNKVLFYNEHKMFSSNFLEQIYITWIDTNIISKNTITKLILDKEYKIIKRQLLD